MAIHFRLASPLSFDGPPPLLGPLSPQQTGPRRQALLHRPLEILVLDAVGVVHILAAQSVAALFVVLAASAQRSNTGQLVGFPGAAAANVERQRRRRRVQFVRVGSEHVVAVRGGNSLLKRGRRGYKCTQGDGDRRLGTVWPTDGEEKS
jgi:hypothetical protein